MGNYSSVYLGRITVREDLDVSEKSDGSLDITGQESMPKITLLDVERRKEDLLGMSGELIPVYFGEKSTLDGFYTVTSSSTTLTEWDGTIGVVAWSASLDRAGKFNVVDFESRLSGTITRANNFSATGKRSHCPPVNAKAYWSGSVAPTYASRTGADGLLKVYQNLSVSTNPRWGCTPIEYGKGRVRFIDSNGFERHGTQVETAGNNWEINNSLIRIKPIGANGTLEISAWTGAAWAVKNWDILYDTAPAVSIGFAEYATVIWNSYECITIRLVKSVGTTGRITVDITLRRGSAFAEVYVQHEFGTTLKIVRATPEAGTAGTGYISATASDSNGFKYFIGSTKTFTGDNVNGGISKAATATLDAAIGIVFDATAGNLASDLYPQYLGSPAEYVQAVRR